jgi:DNA mismatch repair ATPase MutL
LVKVEASHKSILSQIEDRIKNPFDAFNEFIWNSLDANAKNVEITIETGTNSINKMEIVDDRDGINYEKLKEIFLENLMLL